MLRYAIRILFFPQMRYDPRQWSPSAGLLPLVPHTQHRGQSAQVFAPVSLSFSKYQSDVRILNQELAMEAHISELSEVMNNLAK